MRGADNLTTFMCRLSRNSGASTSWNPKDLSRPVAGKLYLYLTLLHSLDIYVLDRVHYSEHVRSSSSRVVSLYKLIIKDQERVIKTDS